MTPDPVPPPKPEGLQFDKVDAGAKAMVCSMCGAKISDAYYHLGEKPICASCKGKVEAQFAQMKVGGRGFSGMTRAVVYGLGAAVAGAGVYYAVIALSGLEIGIVAILIGFMVGWAVRKATRGLGGRRYQFLAVGLTYFAVGLAYTPLAVKELLKSGTAGVVSGPRSGAARDSAILSETEPDEDSAAVSDSTEVSDPTAASDSSSAAPVVHTTAKKKEMGFVTALALAVVFILVLPVLSVVFSMPSGLISAFIIGIGLRQAWLMTAETNLTISGPFKIGAAPAAAAT